MSFQINKKQFWPVFYFLPLILLHVNAILKAEDPISETQTDAILYEQKMEQEKDGVKGPATPKMIYYGGQGFLTKNSVSKYEKETGSGSAAAKKEAFDWSEWWDDKPADPASPELKDPVLPQDTLSQPEALDAPEAIETDSAVVPPIEAVKNPVIDTIQQKDTSKPDTETPQPETTATDDWW